MTRSDMSIINQGEVMQFEDGRQLEIEFYKQLAFIETLGSSPELTKLFETMSAALKELNRLRLILCPSPDLDEAVPLILYFTNREVAEDFFESFQESHPGIKSYRP